MTALRALSRTAPLRALSQTQQKTHLSTTSIYRNSAKPTNTTTNTNPSYPSFSLKRIVPNPRLRLALGAGLVAMALGEGYMWVKFWPRITGKEGKGEGQE
jgi:hypothetical protein